MNEITNKEKVDLLSQTLNYLLESSTDEEIISENLSELEGDYYTFFNPNFTSSLRQNSLISEIAERGINFLFSIINSIQEDQWNTSSFMKSDKWLQARNIAKYICFYLEEFNKSE